VVTPLKDEHPLSIENKLNSLAVRLADLERRLTALEQANRVSKPTDHAPQPVAAKNIDYNYLHRSIDRAKRDYEHKYW